MGRRNKAYHKDLHQQAYDRLTGMQAFGESKKQAVADGTEKDKIFSFSTYKAYWKHVKYFIKYIPRRVHHSRKIQKENGHTRPLGEVSFPVPFPERWQEQDTPSSTSGRTIRTTYTGDARFFQCFPLPCPAWH